MDLDLIYNVYFLGIGGIGMSALARYFHTMGKYVAGYDLSSSSITDTLIHLGIPVHFKEDIDSIDERFHEKERTLIVLTPAVPETHAELKFFKENGYAILKRSEILGMLFNNKHGIAIAGTHGKTTVTSMTAYIIDCSDVGCNAFLGGILKNINSNLILNPFGRWVVAEADEYDRSFLQLFPEIALITWIDADHLDIYASQDQIRDSFIQFLEQTKEGGTIILKKGIEPDFDIGSRKLYSYSLNDKADFYATNISSHQGRYAFNIVTPEDTIDDVQLKVIGLTNVENAVAAASLAWSAGVDKDTIRNSLSSFSGVQRRFDIQYQDRHRVYIDDYAHHPRELDAFISSLRVVFPDRKLTGIFQPHLYSRTRDFASEFAQSLSALDELILLDIYPARELPIEGVSSKIIFDRVSIPAKTMCSKDELLGIIKKKNIEVLLTMGAGDIDRMVNPIKEMMTRQ